MARIPHKVRPPRNPRPVEISSEYQAAVDRSSEKLERRYAKAHQRALKAAERYRSLQQACTPAKKVREALDESMQRWAELREIEKLMTASPAGAAHRGTEGWTKVPR